jgi:signal transduction histidine kinase
MTKYSYSFLLFLLLIGSSAQAQSFTFADTHPVNNADSLEQWLKSHPTAPALLRLRNLIALERTYVWTNRNKIGAYFSEISTLAGNQKQPVVVAAFDYLRAERSLYQKRYLEMAQYSNAAIERFEAIRDTSGLIHAHAILISVNASQFGGTMFNDSYKLEKEHLQLVNTLIRNHSDPHDWLMARYWQFRYVYKKIPDKQLVALPGPVLEKIRQMPACQYAYLTFLKQTAVASAVMKQAQRSLDINQQIAAALTPQQLYENAIIYYNLGINYEELHRLDEAINAYQQCITFSSRCSPMQANLIAFSYRAIRNILIEKKDYRLASLVADSCLVYYDKANTQDMETKVIELETQYALKRRQRENELLRQRDASNNTQQRNYAIALAASVIVILIIAFLAIGLFRNRSKLQQANTQLTQLLHEREQTNTELFTALADVQQLNKTREHFISVIAHDMRRPLISFRGLAALVSRLLKQEAYQDIKDVSKAIDSVGLDIETMFDNLLNWALAQREAIPYQPETVVLTTVLHKVANLFQQLVQFQTITISLSCPEMLSLWIDPNALELIVRNLVDNALKNTNPGGTINITCTELATNTVQISIADTGQGIEPEKLTFLQSVLAGQVRGDIGQNGLGMGLLLVRDFTVRNGGTIGVASVLGQGSSFFVTFSKE